MKYDEWLRKLDERQVRALACQCGVGGWRVADPAKLRKRLLSNAKAKRHFGKDSGIQD